MFYHIAFLSSELDACDWSASRLDHFTPGERVPTPIEQEAVWAPGQVWMMWIKEKYLAVTGFEPRTVQPVVYSLYGLPVPGMQVCNCVLRLSEA